MALNFSQICRDEDITMREWLDELPNDLVRDAVGLWEFDRAGLYLFGLTSEDNLLFMRLCIKALYDAGARPVKGGNGTIYDWIPLPEFGETYEEIADKVIAWWLEGIRTKGYDDFWVDYVWFATPHLCRPHKNKPLAL